MSKPFKALAAIIIALFTVAVLGLLGMRMAYSQSPQAQFRTGGLGNAITVLEDAGLNTGAFSHVDVYGTDYPIAANACGGDTPETIKERLNPVLSQVGIALTGEGLPESVKVDEGYVLLIRADGSVVADHYPNAQLNVCAGKLTVIPPNTPVQLAKTDAGWILAS